MISDVERDLFVRSPEHPENIFTFGPMVNEEREDPIKTVVDMFVKEVGDEVEREALGEEPPVLPSCPDFCRYEELSAKENGETEFSQYLQSIHTGTPEQREHLSAHLRDDGTDVPWESFSGKQYLDAHLALQGKTYGKELDTVRHTAVSSAQKVYGERRSLEDWEWREDEIDGETGNPTPEIVAIRSLLFENLTEGIVEKSRRIDTVLKISSILEQAMQRYTAMEKKVEKITDLSQANSFEEAIQTIERLFELHDDTDFIEEVAQATNHLERMINATKDIPENEKTLERDLTIEEELRHIFGELMESPPVAGSENQ
jgi:hypothetical protein